MNFNDYLKAEEGGNTNIAVLHVDWSKMIVFQVNI